MVNLLDASNKLSSFSRYQASRYQAQPGNGYLEALPLVQWRQSLLKAFPGRARERGMTILISRSQAQPGNGYLEALPLVKWRQSLLKAFPGRARERENEREPGNERERQ